VKDTIGIALFCLGVGLYALSWLTIVAWILFVGANPEWAPAAVAALYIGAAHTLVD